MKFIGLFYLYTSIITSFFFFYLSHSSYQTIKKELVNRGEKLNLTEKIFSEYDLLILALSFCPIIHFGILYIIVVEYHKIKDKIVNQMLEEYEEGAFK